LKIALLPRLLFLLIDDVPKFGRCYLMLTAFVEARGVVSAALLTGLGAIAKKTFNTRSGIGCLPFGRRQNEEREQCPGSVLHHSLRRFQQCVKIIAAQIAITKTIRDEILGQRMAAILLS
jgi:hypothetical protein